MAQAVTDVTVATSLNEIGNTLKKSLGLQKATFKIVNQDKKSLREDAIGEQTKQVSAAKEVIQKPSPDAGGGGGGGGRSLKGMGFDWLKWFGILGLGVFLKDQIGGFLKGAFGALGGYIKDWFFGTFVPALAKLTDKIFGEGAWEKLLGISETVIAGLTKAWDAIKGVGTFIDQKLKDWFGIDIGGIFTNIKEGLTQFGKDVGFLGEDGSLTTGAWFGVAAIGATFLTLAGPLGGVLGVFKGIALLPFKALGGAFKALIAVVKAPFKLLGAAGKGLLNLVKGPKVPKTPKAPAAPKTPTPKVVKPGDVVTSKAGNKVLAGADGKPTTIKPGDAKGKAAILKAADKAGTTKGVTPKPAAGAAAPKPGAAPAKPATGGGGGGRAPSAPKAPNAGVLNRFPNAKMALKFAKRIPLLGSLISAGMIGMTLADDSLSTKEKIARVTGALGGIGGAVLGGFLGALGGGLVGAAGGPLAAATAFIGGLGGAVIGGLLGDSIFEGLAQWMLGEKVTAFPEIWRPWPMDNIDVNALFNQSEPKPTPKPAPDNIPKMGTMTGKIVGYSGSRSGDATGEGGSVPANPDLTGGDMAGAAGAPPPIAPAGTAGAGGSPGGDFVNQAGTADSKKQQAPAEPVVINNSQAAPAPVPGGGGTNITNISMAQPTQRPKDSHRRYAYGSM